MTVLFKPLQKFVCIVWLIELDDVCRVVGVDLINVFSQLAARLSLEVLNLLEATALHECALGLEILRQNLGELGANVS